jgi:hypothetical protein
MITNPQMTMPVQMWATHLTTFYGETMNVSKEADAASMHEQPSAVLEPDFNKFMNSQPNL